MPRKTTWSTQLTDEQITQMFSDIKPVYRPDEAWLKAQRVQLRGAIAVTQDAGWLRRTWERIQLGWDELPYVWATARPAMAWTAALVLGILVGRFVLSGGAPPQPLSAEQSGTLAPGDLAELIRSGQLENIRVNLRDDPQNPVELNLTMGREMTLTGSADREDILAALEYVLVKDPNPGQRLQSARILGSASELAKKERTMMALISALLTDENAGVRLSIVQSLQGVRTPLVKDAFIKVVLEDDHEGVRLAAVENLASFLDDLSVRTALLLVSRMDPMESVSYRAYQILSNAPDAQDDERLDSQP